MPLCEAVAVIEGEPVELRDSDGDVDCVAEVVMLGVPLCEAVAVPEGDPDVLGVPELLWVMLAVPESLGVIV